MKLLVTGGCGFIGSAVVRLAIDRGYEVVNVDALTYAANTANLKGYDTAKNYAFENVDIRNMSDLGRIFTKHEPDYVLHLAAESHVDRSINAPEEFLTTNVMGTFNLLSASLTYFQNLGERKKHHFRFQHISTDEVYGDLNQDDLPFTESTAYNPSSPYSASKAASDHLVRSWHRTYGLPVVLTNCSNNYGPFQFPEKLIPVVILKALDGKPIPVYGNGTNIRDWLFVDDHAKALLLVLEKGRLGETYNIGGNNERSNIEVVQTLCDLMDRHSPTGRKNHRSLISFVEDRLGHDKRYAVSTDKINNDLGWSPEIDWYNGFERTVLWYLENEDWWTPQFRRGNRTQNIGKSSDQND
jgi:dTDP-glucose 4,6-dehydratase